MNDGINEFYNLICGKLLGTGCIVTPQSQRPYFQYIHRKEDSEWALHCYDRLNNYIPFIKDPRNIEEFSERYLVKSESNDLVAELYRFWHPFGKKVIPLHFLEQYLDECALAWWYQDRGHLKKKDNGTLEKLVLSTEYWTDQERGLLQYVLNLKFGLLFTIDGQKRLLLYNQLEINHFLKLVNPWMHSSMTRKMKTTTVLKPIAPRTTIRLTNQLTLKKPTSEINNIIQQYGSSIQLSLASFKRLNYSRREQNDTTLYQVTLTSENRHLISTLQSNTGLSMNEIVQECFHQQNCHSPQPLQTLDDLTTTQQNIILGSILGDGMLTHFPTKHMGIRSSYYEHFSFEQHSYRAWKVMKLAPYLTFQKNGTVISSKVDSLWSELEPLFYKISSEEKPRIKRIPISLLERLNNLHSLATLYMDDGSLLISYRVNHRLRKVYLTPHLALYLQNFTYEELQLLNSRIQKLTLIAFNIAKLPDGNGFYLRTFRTADTLQLLKSIQPITETCPTMSYKTNWTYRFHIEKQKWLIKYPDYEVLTSSRERMQPYTFIEIQTIITMKRMKCTDQQIADKLGRSYWAVVYKISELRKNGNL